MGSGVAVGGGPVERYRAPGVWDHVHTHPPVEKVRLARDDHLVTPKKAPEKARPYALWARRLHADPQDSRPPKARCDVHDAPLAGRDRRLLLDDVRHLTRRKEVRGRDRAKDLVLECSLLTRNDTLRRRRKPDALHKVSRREK